MARHHQRTRIFAKRLTDGARQRLVAELLRDFTVGHRPASRNCPRDGIDALVERGRCLVVDDDIAQVARLAAQERGDAVDRCPRIHGRLRLLRAGEAAQEARTRRGTVRRGKLHAGEPAIAPDDAGNAEGRVE